MRKKEERAGTPCLGLDFSIGPLAEGRWDGPGNEKDDGWYDDKCDTRHKLRRALA